MPEAKVFFAGTHRVREPERTWDIIAPSLSRFGISRVADVTGLDVLGIPVAMAVRPLARTLSVSQGKGQTTLLAKISAAMESIELWHAENVHRPVAFVRTPARDLDLPYRISGLVSGPAALVTDRTPLDWTNATGMVTGDDVPVPSDSVSVPNDGRTWSVPGFRWTSNGLASGNSRAEACLHALYEVIERDAVSSLSSGAAREYVDPTSIPDDHCAALIASINSGGATLTIERVPSRFGVPCYRAEVWSPDFPVAAGGSGAHLDAHVAVSRAVTEAVQSRLTAIAGSREDIPPMYELVQLSVEEFVRRQDAPRPWGALDRPAAGPFDDISVELDWLCRQVREITGTEPLVSDLSTADEFAVVRVLVPGTVLDQARVHPASH
jgi:ribosomal protein S12 methylthiotransferase accessory factor